MAAATPAPAAPQKGLGDRIVRASMAVAIAHLTFKLVGLAQAIIAGRYLDDATFDAIYVFAFEGIIWAVFFRLGEETIGPCFLPVFMKEKDERGEAAAWTFANLVLSLQAVILSGVVLLIMLFPEWIIELGTSWTRTDKPEQFELARQSLVWIAPALVCLSLGSTTYMLLNGYKKFFLAAFGEASWKICLVVMLVLGIGLLGWGHWALIVGLLVGSVAKLVTHLLGLRAQWGYLRPCFQWRNPALKALVLLMLPMLVGTLGSVLRDYFNNVYVLSMISDSGLMKANSFGRKLFMAISWMVPYTVSIAMFPFFCELVDKRDHARLGALITQSGRMLLACFIPGAALIAAVSEPIAMALLQGGKFTAVTAQMSAFSNACYILALPAYSLEFILVQGYFANRKMTSLIGLGLFFSFFSVGISYYFIGHLQVTGLGALAAVALGYTVARTLKTIALAVVLSRHVPIFPLASTLWFLLRCSALAILVGGTTFATVYGLGQMTLPLTGRYLALLQLVLASGVGAVVFGFGAWGLRVTEPFTMISWGWAKVRGRLKPKIAADLPPPPSV